MNNPEMWIKKEGAFEGIVPPELFYKRGQTAKARANLEKALLSHVINKAREWSYTDAPNPCQGVKGEQL